VDETGDYLGRKGLKIGVGVGLIVCPLARSRLATVVLAGAAGALVGKFCQHKVESGLGEQLGAALPPGLYGWHHRDLGPGQGRHRGEDLPTP
jgi:hypothetical protein